jgi:deferrochelatase/peroxidase EfeB
MQFKLLISMAPINYASMLTKLKADLPESELEPKKRRRSSTTSFYPTEAQNRLLDVCGYKDFTNPPAFDTIKETNAFVTKYADNKKAFKDRYGSEPCPGDWV